MQGRTKLDSSTGHQQMVRINRNRTGRVPARRKTWTKSQRSSMHGSSPQQHSAIVAAHLHVHYAYRQRHQLHAHQHCAVTPAFPIHTQTHSLTPTGRGSAAKNGCHKTKQLYGMHNSHPRSATAEPVDHKTTAEGRKDPSSEQRTAGPPQCILAGSTALVKNRCSSCVRCGA